MTRNACGRTETISVAVDKDPSSGLNDICIRVLH